LSGTLLKIATVLPIRDKKIFLIIIIGRQTDPDLLSYFLWQESMTRYYGCRIDLNISNWIQEEIYYWVGLTVSGK
jgi:hypothetical protein